MVCFSDRAKDVNISNVTDKTSASYGRAGRDIVFAAWYLFI